ncbi:hypothetical protein QUB47_21955 [Microcoleus sp. AT9_B5]
MAAKSIYNFSDRAFTLSRTSSPGTSRFYCPRPGLQSTKPNASVSRKLAIEMAIETAIGYSIRTQQRDSKQSVCKRIISLFPKYS